MKTMFYTQAYNAEDTLSKAIESVLRQTESNLEYHLLDNGSTYSTGEIVDAYAKMDSRVIPYHAKENDPFIYRTFFRNMLERNPNADYFVHLDADDEYTPDFLEQMFIFLAENHLDCGACGTHLIDLENGQQISERVLEKDYIIEGDTFSTGFLIYRRYYMQLWGKVFKTSLLKKYYAQIDAGIARAPGIIDFEMTLGFLANAKRAGILAKGLHRFNQHPTSLTRTCFEGVDAHLTDWINIIREYLNSFGPVSKGNQDYLYAIYMGQLEDILGVILGQHTLFCRKMELLTEIFNLKDTLEMLRCQADAQFHNLVARNSFLKNLENWILTQEEYKQNEDAAKEILYILRGEMLNE